MKIKRSYKKNKHFYKAYRKLVIRNKREQKKGLFQYKPIETYITSYLSNIKSITDSISSLRTFDITPIVNAFSSIQETFSNFQKFEKLLPPIYETINSPILEITRATTIATAELSRLSKINEFNVFVTPKFDEWYDKTIIRNDYNVPQPYSSEDLIKSTQRLTDVFGIDNLSRLSIQANLANATECAVFAEKSLASFPWSKVGSIVGLSEAYRDSISKSFIGLSTDYTGLVQSFGSVPNSFTELSPLLTRTAPTEYYTSADLIEQISTIEKPSVKEEKLKNEIQYENKYSLQQYLPRVDPRLLNMWKGAIEALNSNNSDKIRHFTVSLRELFGHLMRLLAPDDDIRKWSTDPRFYENNKPTRSSRLHYICRSITNKPFNRFIEKDIQTTLEFIDLFQEGTHSIESSLTPMQLTALRSKAETTIRFLLEIEFSANR